MNLNDKGGTVTYHVISELGKQYAQWVQTVCTEDVPNPGIKPGSPALQIDSLPAELPEKPHYVPNTTLF